MKKLVLTVWDDGLWLATTDEGGETIAKGEWSRSASGHLTATTDGAVKGVAPFRDTLICEAVLDAVRVMGLETPVARGARG